MITVPPSWAPIAPATSAASSTATALLDRPSWPHAVVAPAGAGPALSARLDDLRRAGWDPRVIATTTAPGGAATWRDAAQEADRLLEAVTASAATDVDVWAQDPLLLLSLVEQLWHHGVRTRVVVDPSVAHPRVLAALASGTGALTPDASAVLDACAHADAVVLTRPLATPLLARYAGPFGSIEPVGSGHPAAVPAPPRPVVLDGGLQLSVLVTTHDREDVLESCLLALCEQTLPRSAFEVVVVDDGSPRPPHAVVERFADRLAVRLVALPENLGPGGARTEGLAHVLAPVTLLLDDDDLPTPRCLEEHLLTHQEHPEESVAVLGATSVVPGGRVTALSRHVMTVGRQYFAYPSVSRGDVHPWKAFWCGRSSAKTSLLRRRAFLAPLMEDADFAFRARQDGLRVVFARRALQVVTDRLELRHFHRRQNRIGQAMLDLAERCADDEVWTWAGLRPVMANLERWVAQRDVVREVAGGLLDQPLGVLRDAPHASGSVLQLLDSALFVELDAHYAAGMLAGLARRRADAAGRPLRVAALATDPGAVDLVDRLASSGAARGLDGVVLAPTAEAAEAFVAEVVARCGADVAAVAPVEVRVGALDPALHDDVDVVLPGSLGAAWRPGQPTPLIGQDTASWLHQLAGAGGPAGSLR